MKKNICYEFELTDEESDAVDEAWEDTYGGIINDPWYGTKKMLIDFFEESIEEDEMDDNHEFPKYWTHLKSIKEKIKDLKDDDDIRMVIGL